MLAASSCGGAEGKQAPSSATVRAPEKTSLTELAYPTLLPPGSYVTRAFTPRFTFRVGDGGWFADNPTDRFATLYRAKEEDKPWISFLRPNAVRDPVNQDEDIAFPDDLVAWLARHPNLKAGNRSSATVGAVTGDALDVEVKTIPKNYDDGCDEPCVSIAGGTAWFQPLNLYKGEKARFIVLDIGGEPVLVMVGADRGAFSRFVPEAEKVLASVKWSE